MRKLVGQPILSLIIVTLALAGLFRWSGYSFLGGL